MNNQKQETLIKRVGPIQWCNNYNHVCQILKLIDALPTPWGIQMWVPNKKQRKEEWGHAP